MTKFVAAPRGVCRYVLAAIFCLVISCAILTQAAFAQTKTISGAVHDSTGAAISGAQVELQTSSSSITTTTDSTGNFTFGQVSAADGKIVVTARGMAPYTQTWTSSSPALEVTLQPQSLSEQVTVTATRTQTRLGDTPISLIQLLADDLQATPNLTLDDALRQVPGFSIFRRSSSRTANPTTEGVSLRGTGASGASRVLVLEDGIPLNDPFGGWIYWDRVPSEEISSVEVDQEGASSLYGSNALGGVVQILTRPPEPGGISAEIAYGNQNSPDFSVWGGGGYKGWQASVGAQVFHTDGYFLVPEVNRSTVDTKAGVEDQAVDLTIRRKIGANSYVFARGWYLNESRNNGTVATINTTSLGEGALGADLDLKSAGHLSLRFYGDFQSYYQTFSSVATNRNSETLSDRQSVPAQAVGGSATWSRSLGRRQTVVAGYEQHEEIGHSNEIIGTVAVPTANQVGGGHQRTVAFFGEDLIQLAPKWVLGVSARYDNWRNFDSFIIRTPLPTGARTTNFPADVSYNVFDPRGTLTYQVSRNISWGTSVYRSFRAPTLNELYRQFRQGATTTLANPALRAERLTGVESGVAVQGLDKRLVVRAAFFYNQMVNPIANVPCVAPLPAGSPCPNPSPANTQMRQNLGRTSAPGFEVDATARITNHFDFSTGYQYVNAKIISAPAVPSLVDTWVQQVPHSAYTFQARYSSSRLGNFSVNGRFIGQQLDTNGGTLDNFFVLDAMASRTLCHGVTAFVAAENLLNQTYYTAAPTFSGATLTAPPQLGLPITARFGLKFSWPSVN